MVDVIQTVTPETTFVKVNRLKDSYTWNVQVAAETRSLDDVRLAKETAVAIVRELENELRQLRATRTKHDNSREGDEVEF